MNLTTFSGILLWGVGVGDIVFLRKQCFHWNKKYESHKKIGSIGYAGLAGKNITALGMQHKLVAEGNYM